MNNQYKIGNAADNATDNASNDTATDNASNDTAADTTADNASNDTTADNASNDNAADTTADNTADNASNDNAADTTADNTVDNASNDTTVDNASNDNAVDNAADNVADTAADNAYADNFLPKFCPNLNKVGKICVLAVIILICIAVIVVIILGSIKYASTRLGCLSYTAIKNKCCKYGVARGGGCNVGPCSHKSRRTKNGVCCGQNGVASNTEYCYTIKPQQCKQLLNCTAGTCQPFSYQGKCCLYGVTHYGNACYPSECKTTKQGGVIGRTTAQGHCTCKYGKAKNGKTKYNGGCAQKCTVDMGEDLKVSYNGVCCKSGLARGFVGTVTEENGDIKTTLIQYCIQRDCPNFNAVTKAGQCCSASQKLIFEYGNDNTTFTRCDEWPHNYPTTSQVISKRGNYCKYGVAKIKDKDTCNSSNIGAYSRANPKYDTKSFAYSGKYCPHKVAMNTVYCNEAANNGDACEAADLTQNGKCCADGVSSYYNDNLYMDIPYRCKTTLCESPNILVYTPTGKQCCAHGKNAAGTKCAPPCTSTDKYTLKKNRCCKYGKTTAYKTRCNAPCTTNGKGIEAGKKAYSATKVLTAAGYCCANGIAFESYDRYAAKIHNVLCNQSGTFKAFTALGKGCKDGLATHADGSVNKADCKVKCTKNPTKSINTSKGACFLCPYGATQAYFRTVEKKDGVTVSTTTNLALRFAKPKTKNGKTLCIKKAEGTACTIGGITKSMLEKTAKYTSADGAIVVIGSTKKITADYKDKVLHGKKCNRHCGLYDITIKGGCTHTAIYNQTRSGYVCKRGSALIGDGYMTHGANGKGQGRCMSGIDQGEGDNRNFVKIAPNQVCVINIGYSNSYCFQNPDGCKHSKRGAFCGYTLFGDGCQYTTINGCLDGGKFPSRGVGITNLGVNGPACSNTVTQYTKIVNGIKSCRLCPYGVTAKYKTNCNIYCGCGVEHTEQGNCDTPYKRGQTLSGACCPHTGSAVCSKGKKCTAKFNAANNGTSCTYATSACNNCFKPKSKCPRTLAGDQFCGNTQSGACVPLSSSQYACSDQLTAGLAKYKPRYFPSYSFRYTQENTVIDDNA